MAGPTAFKARDLTRAVKAVRKAGMALAEVVIQPGGEICLRTLTSSAEIESVEDEIRKWKRDA